MNRSRSRLLPVAAGVVAATLALGACSTGTPESSGGSPGETTARRADPVVAGAGRAAESEPPADPARASTATAAVREFAAADAALVRERGRTSTAPVPSPADIHAPVAPAGAGRYASIDPSPVRVEEPVNHFGYDYPVPDDSARPFSVTTTLAPTPWADTELLRIGIRGLEPEGGTGPANLVFLVDASGSMNSPDKLGPLKSSLSLLARGLGSEDRVSIVTYAGSAGTVLDGVAGDDMEAIDAALDGLAAGGGTDGEAGILSAYRSAPATTTTS